MHLFQFAFYTAGALYALFTQQILIFYFLIIVGAYILISMYYPKAKSIGIRKKIMVSTWTPPSQGVILVRVATRVDKVINLIQSLPKQNRPTLTHFVTKAIGEILLQCPDLNGKLVFGKFVQHQTINVSCLVDIDGGKDLAFILVQDIAKKSVYDISNFVRQKSSHIKHNKGDKDHKQRTGVAKFLPAFLLSILMKVSTFIYHNLGLTVKPLSMKKDQFGAACLTSLGMLGFSDATAPFSGFTGVTMFVALNQTQQQAVVQDGKIQIGKVAQINFQVDHRYVDGGKCKNLTSAFLSVFKNPERFLNSSGIKMQQSQHKKQQ